MKVEVVKAAQTDGISLNDGDVCLLRCGGVVMVEPGSNGTFLFSSEGAPKVGVDECGKFGCYRPNQFDIIRVLGNGQAFYDAVRVKVEVPGV